METLSVFRFRESRLLYNLVCYCRNSIGITIPAAVIVIQSNLDAIVLLQVKVLYVRNLKSEVTEEQLKEKFEAYGKVERVKKIKDYGFIHFEERDSALRAMEDLNGAVGVGRSWMFCGLNSLPSFMSAKFLCCTLSPAIADSQVCIKVTSLISYRSDWNSWESFSVRVSHSQQIFNICILNWNHKNPYRGKFSELFFRAKVITTKFSVDTFCFLFSRIFAWKFEILCLFHRKWESLKCRSRWLNLHQKTARKRRENVQRQSAWWWDGEYSMTMLALVWWLFGEHNKLEAVADFYFQWLNWKD